MGWKLAAVMIFGPSWPSRKRTCCASTTSGPHTAEEMEKLAGRFPDNIQLYTASRGGVMLGGVILYRGGCVDHAQYIASTEEGRGLFVLDAIMDVLLSEVCAGTPYFDFGISTEEGGQRLNVGLIDNKESYGARAVAYDFYEFETGG